MTAQYLLSNGQIQAFNNGGTLAGGAKLYVYEAGTTTPLDTYTTDALDPLSVNSNPIVADSNGRFGAIFLAADDYKFVCKSSDDATTFFTADDYTVEGTLTFSGGLQQTGSTVTLATSVNLQTGTSYTYVTGDRGKSVVHNSATAVSATLPAAGASFPDGWYMDVINEGNGKVTITSSSNIDGAGTLILGKYDGVRIFSDGSTYYSNRGINYNITRQAASTLTIASGAITVDTSGLFVVDTEGAAASDNLDTITAAFSGQQIILRSANDARDIVVRTGMGNIDNPSGQNITLGSTYDQIALRWDGVRWIVQWASTGELEIGAIQINSGSRSAQGQLPAAWCTFNGTGSDPITIVDGYNVTNVTKTATGRFTVNFTTALPSTNYAVIGSCSNGTDAATNPEAFGVSTKNTTSVVINTVDNITNTLVDCAITDLVVFCKLT